MHNFSAFASDDNKNIKFLRRLKELLQKVLQDPEVPKELLFCFSIPKVNIAKQKAGKEVRSGAGSDPASLYFQILPDSDLRRNDGDLTFYESIKRLSVFLRIKNLMKKTINMFD